jgi:hypothetical protein
MVREWLKTARQADIDAYDEGLECYGITKERCEKQWNEIWKQLFPRNKLTKK